MNTSHTFKIIEAPETQTPGWTPNESPHLLLLMERAGLSISDQQRFHEETTRILKRCVEPTWAGPEDSVSLVLGRVQSGKTLSFTGVCTVAVDNKIPLIVILAGTKNNLLEQTYSRLAKDLGQIFTDEDLPVIVKNPTSRDLTAMQDRIDSFAEDDGLFPPRTTIMVVLKHEKRIRETARLLGAIPAASGLLFPALIIDDEADQAGLNTLQAKADESPVYRAIQELRTALQRHTYLMYTATPEAPLLLATSDNLAPRTVTVLRPGAGYTGGDELFGPGSQFVTEIPDAEIDDAFDATVVSPPPSLLQALDYFMMVLCHGANLKPQVKASMLVHPSSSKDHHEKFYTWVNEYLAELKSTLGEDDRSYVQDVLMAQFCEAYDALVQNAGRDEVKPLEVFVSNLGSVTRNVLTKLVNSDTKDGITADEWRQNHGVIVTGGNVLDRGYTVENLAVTYMPRGRGVGNADTIQQRGRFFGYRKKLRPLLRGWFPAETANAFRAYVDHEALVRRDLEELDRKSLPLSAWRRKFFMKHALQPTRSAVISANVMNLPMDRSAWQFKQQRILCERAAENEKHLGCIKVWFSNADLDFKDQRADVQKRHRRAVIEFAELLSVLSEWEVDRGEALYFTNTLYAAASFVAPSELVEIIDIDGWFSGNNETHRTRSVADGWQSSINPGEFSSSPVKNLHQGRDQGTRFPGDREFRNRERLTVQFHRVGAKDLLNAPQPCIAICLSLPDYIRGKVVAEV